MSHTCYLNGGVECRACEIEEARYDDDFRLSFEEAESLAREKTPDADPPSVDDPWYSGSRSDW